MTDEHEVVEGEVMEDSEGLPVLPAAPITRISDQDMALPAMNIEVAEKRYRALGQFVQRIMRKGIDYGEPYAGSTKDTLLKPGAEKLSTFFGLHPVPKIIQKIEQWDRDDPLFYYHYRIFLYRHGEMIAAADGSANSREDRYRWRWVSREKLPASIDPADVEQRFGRMSEYAFAIDKAETTGKYGKPAEYWEKWSQAIENGTAIGVVKTTATGKEMEAFEMDTTLYRIENPDVFSQVNTINKMAYKRALVAAILVGANASDYFTQDIEDMPPEALTGQDDEFTPAPPWAGEADPPPKDPPAAATPAVQDDEPDPDRPYSPAQLRSRLMFAATQIQDAIDAGREWALESVANIKNLRGAVAGNIEKTFAGDPLSKEKRHSFLAFVWGVDSLTKLTDAQVLAHKKHLNWSEDSGGDWNPDPIAATEIRMAVDERISELGQASLFTSEIPATEELIAADANEKTAEKQGDYTEGANE